jgi:NitT/TauT family transport system substrate-binding protein
MLIHRIAFLAALASQALGLAHAQPATPQKVTLLHAQSVISPAYAYASSLPSYLGYWRDEGLDVEITRAETGTAAAAALIAGRADAAVMSVAAVMNAVQRGADLRVYYTSIRGDTFGVAVPSDSGLRSLTDLRGKTLGVASVSSGGSYYARALLRSIGLEAGRDYAIVETGTGARAAAAYAARQVQAFALDDLEHMRLALQGVTMTSVITDPRAQTHGAGALAVRNPDIAAKRALLIGLARGIAKAQLFQTANPEAAVRIHWRVFPETAPPAGPSTTAVRNEMRVLAVRDGLIARDAGKTNRWGELTRDGVIRFQSYLVDAGVLTQPVEPARYFTNDLIEEINRFDEGAVARAARAYKIP